MDKTPTLQDGVRLNDVSEKFHVILLEAITKVIALL